MLNPQYKHPCAEHGPLIAYRVESFSNGKPPYMDGTMPQDHIAVFEYARATVRWDGRKWSVERKEAAA